MAEFYIYRKSMTGDGVVVKANPKFKEEDALEYIERWGHKDIIMMVGDEESSAVEELTEAIRYTVEYVGLQTLPPIAGWSWYDAMLKYAPEKAAAFRESFNRSGA